MGDKDNDDDNDDENDDEEEDNNCFTSSRYDDAPFHCENDGPCLPPLSDIARRMMVIVDDVVSEIVHTEWNSERN